MSTKQSHRSGTSGTFGTTVPGKSLRKEYKAPTSERVVKPSPHTGSLSYSRAKAAVTAVMLSREK
jgi:hypothetical protein